MSILVQIVLAFASVAVLLGLMKIVRRLAAAVGLNAEVQRKLMHVGTGLFALSLPWLFPARWPVYMLVGVTMVVMAVLRLPRFANGIGAALHGVDRTSYGDFLLALSVGLCFLLAGESTLFYVLPIAVLTLADAAAALAGTTYGTKRFVVEDGEKSIEGSVVFFVVALLVAIICFLFFSDLPAINVIMLCVMVAAFGTLVEAQSWRGFDNLFLPLGLLIFLAIHYESSVFKLAALAALFFVSLISFRTIGKRIGLTTHATRVYVVAVFLVLAVTEYHNAVLPLLVLAAHIWARSANPCDSAYPDLDVVASLGLFSFGWLALGNATGWNAVSFYAISSMGLAMGLCTVAVQGRAIGMLALGAIAAALLAIRIWVVSLNFPPANWGESLTVLAALTLAFAVGMPLIVPRLFKKDRVLRLTLLALAPPLTYYIWFVAGSLSEGIFKGLTS